MAYDDGKQQSTPASHEKLGEKNTAARLQGIEERRVASSGRQSGACQKGTGSGSRRLTDGPQRGPGGGLGYFTPQ